MESTQKTKTKKKNKTCRSVQQTEKQLCNICVFCVHFGAK